MQPVEPVLVVDLFPEERRLLLDLLANLTDEQWRAPTACAGWSVKDVALHLLGGDLSTDWCSSPPEWRGNELWVSCSDNGFMTLRLDERVYTAPADQRSTVGS